jgi:hypothetical protein
MPCPTTHEREEPEQHDRVLRRHAHQRGDADAGQERARQPGVAAPRRGRDSSRPAASSADHASTAGAEDAELGGLMPPPVLRVVERERHLPRHAPVVGRDDVIHAGPTPVHGVSRSICTAIVP